MEVARLFDYKPTPLTINKLRHSSCKLHLPQYAYKQRPMKIKYMTCMCTCVGLSQLENLPLEGPY